MNILSAKEAKAIKGSTEQPGVSGWAVLVCGSNIVVYCMFNKCISTGM